MKLQKSDYIFGGIVLIAFYFLNRLSLSIGDDYWYSFVYDDVSDSYRRIDSFSDALNSQIGAYFSHNGRLIVHTVVSYFCGVLGETLFQIVNTIVFVLLCIGLVKLVRDEFGYLKNDKYVVVFGAFVLLPCPGTILLGSIAMCVNYLWVACATIYFILFYRSIVSGSLSNGLFVKTFCFTIALLYGSLQESFTVGVTFALFLYYCFHISKLRGNELWIVLGLIFGSSLVVLSPGNFVRFEQVDSSGGLLKHISNLLLAILNSKTFILMFIFSIYLLWKDYRYFICFLKNNIIYYIAILTCFCMTFFAYSGERQLTCIELFSLILLLKFLFGTCNKYFTSNTKKLSIALSVVLLLMYVPIYNYRLTYYNAISKLYESKIENNITVCPEYIRAIRELNSNYLANNYTYVLDFSEKWMYTGLSCYITDGKDLYAVRAILMDDVRDIVRNFKINNIDGVYYDKSNMYYVVKGNISAVTKLVKEKYKPVTIFGKIRSFMRGNGGIDSRTLPLSIYFDNGDERYFIIYNNVSYESISVMS